MNETRYVTQELTLKDRKTLSLNTVKTINEFNDDFLELSTALGDVCIEGEELKIEEFIQDSGAITIRGNVNAIFYKKEKASRKFKLSK